MDEHKLAEVWQRADGSFVLVIVQPPKGWPDKLSEDVYRTMIYGAVEMALDDAKALVTPT